MSDPIRYYKNFRTEVVGNELEGFDLVTIELKQWAVCGGGFSESLHNREKQAIAEVESRENWVKKFGDVTEQALKLWKTKSFDYWMKRRDILLEGG